MNKQTFTPFSRLVWPLLLLLATLFIPLQSHAASAQEIAIDGPIGPPTASFVERGLEKAAKLNAPLVVIRLDTPGGLSSAMRRIIQAILAAPMPVACWVGPEGARAASAGTYIMYACDVAAMAPGTNIGAATPVQLSGLGGSNTPAKPQNAEQQKVLNDAIAYITSLAEASGRNVEWAKKAVKTAESISAETALNKHVIDLMAASPADLLNKLDGRKVGDAVLHTANLHLQQIQPTWQEEFLSVLANPSLAYLLLMIGIFGLILEGMHPGSLLPGTVGAICLILALFALQAVSANWAGVALILLGAALVVSEAFVPSFGALGLGGVAAFVIGSIMTFDQPAPGFSLPIMYIGSIGLLIALALIGLMYFLMKFRKSPVVSGEEHLLGLTVKALQNFDSEGYVLAEGERWLAHSTTPISQNTLLTVTKVEGLTLTVEPKELHP